MFDCQMCIGQLMGHSRAVDTGRYQLQMLAIQNQIARIGLIRFEYDLGQNPRRTGRKFKREVNGLNPVMRFSVIFEKNRLRGEGCHKGLSL